MGAIESLLCNPIKEITIEVIPDKKFKNGKSSSLPFFHTTKPNMLAVNYFRNLMGLEYIQALLLWNTSTL